jgi:signal transduction histidine kinase
MKIENFIKRDFVVASPFAGVKDLKKQLFINNAVVIIEDEQYFGVLTPYDVVRKPYTLAIDCLSAKSEMKAENTLEFVLQTMKYENTDVLPVFDENKIFGLIFKNDILDYLNEQNADLQSKIVQHTKILEQQNSEFKDKIQQQKIDLENIIEQRTKELIDLVETKDKFIQIIAHELRNPFNSILGFLNLLQKNLREYDTDKIEKFLTQIYRSASITFDLLVNLLDWFNAKNKTITFNPEKTQICQILNEEISTTQLFAEQKQIKINNLISENIYATGDKNMVKTIFRNLINNGIKFTPNGGLIDISAIENQDFIEISIKDSGVGLSPEIIENIFKIEGIKSLTGTENEKGSGLGLILCKEFVEIEGGKIWVESSIGNGSEFKFSLPKFLESKS